MCKSVLKLKLKPVGAVAQQTFLLRKKMNKYGKITVLALKKKLLWRRSAIKEGEQGKLFYLISAEGKIIKVVSPRIKIKKRASNTRGYWVHEGKKNSFPRNTWLGRFFRGAHLLPFICSGSIKGPPPPVCNYTSSSQPLSVYITTAEDSNIWMLVHRGWTGQEDGAQEKQQDWRTVREGWWPDCVQITLNYSSIDYQPGSLLS